MAQQSPAPDQAAAKDAKQFTWSATAQKRDTQRGQLPAGSQGK